MVANLFQGGDRIRSHTLFVVDPLNLLLQELDLGSGESKILICDTRIPNASTVEIPDIQNPVFFVAELDQFKDFFLDSDLDEIATPRKNCGDDDAILDI